MSKPSPVYERPSHRTMRISAAALAALFLATGVAAQKSLPEAGQEIADRVAEKVVSRFGAQTPLLIAVVPFALQKPCPAGAKPSTALSDYLARSILTSLADKGRVRVVERAQLDQALKELKLGESAYFSDENARRIGQLLQADAVVLGEIVPLVSFMEVFIRVMDVGSGELAGGTKVQMVWDDNLRQIFGTGCEGVDTRSDDPKDSEPPVPDGKDRKAGIHGLTRDGFRFRVIECFVKGDAVHCALGVTSLEEDQKLQWDVSNCCEIQNDRGGIFYSTWAMVSGRTLSRDQVYSADNEVRLTIPFLQASDGAGLINVLYVRFKDRSQLKFTEIPIRK